MPLILASRPFSYNKSAVAEPRSSPSTRPLIGVKSSMSASSHLLWHVRLSYSSESGVMILLCIKGFVPLSAQDPGKSRHSATQESPLKIVPSQVLLAILIFDLLCCLLRLLQDRLLFLSQ